MVIYNSTHAQYSSVRVRVYMCTAHACTVHVQVVPVDRTSVWHITGSSSYSVRMVSPTTTISGTNVTVQALNPGEESLRHFSPPEQNAPQPRQCNSQGTN